VPNVTATSRATIADAPNCAGLRVLIVEDDLLISMLLEEMLHDLGCDVVGPAPNLKVAEVLLAAHEPDCAIVDINIKGKQSYPLATALTARGIPFIFITGYSQDEIAAPFRGTPLLQKPFRPHELGKILDGFLRQR